MRASVSNACPTAEIALCELLDRKLIFSDCAVSCVMAAGVSLPHSSQAQYASLPHVSQDQLAPGDLVFYGSPIHHVGMYLGGGMYIHAPQTGDVVKISPYMRGDYAGAARPG